MPLAILLFLLLQLVEAPGWSNGRDVVTLVKRIFRSYALAQDAVKVSTCTGDTSGDPSASVFHQSLGGILSYKQLFARKLIMPIWQVDDR